MSALTPVLKDYIYIPENGGKLKHCTPSILYISLKVMFLRIWSEGKLFDLVYKERNIKSQSVSTYIIPICRKV